MFTIQPARGILAPSAEARFSIIFRPAAVVSYDRPCKLVVDTSFPPREPHPGWPMMVGPARCCSPHHRMSLKSRTIGFKARQMTWQAKLGRPYMTAPVTVEDFTIAGVGAARDVVLGNHLLNFAGSLLLGKTYEGEVRLTNNSDSVVDYDWSGQGSGVMVYPPAGQLEPAGGAVVCVVAVTCTEVTRVDRTLVCRVEHGPNLPLRVQADVEGPEVAIAQVRPCSSSSPRQQPYSYFLT